MNEDKLLVVIPCFNEIKYISTLLDALPELKNIEIVVVDGGSTDGTQTAVMQSKRTVQLLNNPKKVQSAGVNLAVEKFGANARYFIRLDVHAKYPENFIQDLLAEAHEVQADSIVVSMEAVGKHPIQQAIAAAQNSILGNGGSAHRNENASGRWIDHGHHALMLVESFRKVCGYDESFVANEDAELDFRLIQAGYKIWLTAKTKIIYYPRTSFKGLIGQYYRYGLGRASNVLKHREKPKVRQMVQLSVFPALLLMLLAFIHWFYLLPFLVWLVLCLTLGCWLAFKNKNILHLLSAPAVAAMHLAWSIGFFHKLASFCINSLLAKRG